MRYGASVFLGLVAAEMADHGDCARFQITCPVCHEAVFKGVLVRSDGRETHYFSHYREVPSEQAGRCELRVSSINAAQVEKAKAEAHGQALATFVARFEECLLRCFSEKDRRTVANNLDFMRRRPAWRGFLRSVRSGLRADEVWEHALRVNASFSAESKVVEMWRVEAEAHSRAMLEYAMSPHASRAWQALCGATLAHAYTRIRHSRYHEIMEFLEPLLLGGDGTVRRWLRDAMRHGRRVVRYEALGHEFYSSVPSITPKTQSARDIVVEVILTNIPNFLNSIPYEEILRETIGGQARRRTE